MSKHTAGRVVIRGNAMKTGQDIITMTSKPSFCPECSKNGFPGTPSMKDHPLCGDCHDIAEVNAQELAEWQALQEWPESEGDNP